MKKKPKKHSPTYYRKKLVEKAKFEAKERDNWTCQYCGKTKLSGWAIHGSHILSEGAYPLMSVEPYNIIALCAICHQGGFSKYGIGVSKVPSWHGDPGIFMPWFESKWPGRIKELREMNEEKKKHLINWKLRYEEINSPTD